MMENDLGLQPLDAIMARENITAADLVKASAEQLNFKQVNKARKGRRLTLNIQIKVLRALQSLRPEQKFDLPMLFNY